MKPGEIYFDTKGSTINPTYRYSLILSPEGEFSLNMIDFLHNDLLVAYWDGRPLEARSERYKLLTDIFVEE